MLEMKLGAGAINLNNQLVIHIEVEDLYCKYLPEGFLWASTHSFASSLVALMRVSSFKSIRVDCA